MAEKAKKPSSAVAVIAASCTFSFAVESIDRSLLCSFVLIHCHDDDPFCGSRLCNLFETLPLQLLYRTHSL